MKTSLKRATKFVSKLGLAHGSHYYLYIDYLTGKKIPSKKSNTPLKKPTFYLPKYPELYWDDFKEMGGWGLYLGPSYRGSRKYPIRPFRSALKFVRALKLQGQNDWYRYCRGELAETHGLRPEDIPTNPDKRKEYKGLYKNLGHWLGTGNVSCRDMNKDFWSYEKASTYIQEIGISSSTMYRKWINGELEYYPERPQTMPLWPDYTYKGKGWISWPEFCGNSTQRPFQRICPTMTKEKFIETVQVFKIKSELEYDFFKQRYATTLSKKRIWLPPRKDLSKYYPGLVLRDVFLGKTPEQISNLKIRAYAESRL